MARARYPALPANAVRALESVRRKWRKREGVLAVTLGPELDKDGRAKGALAIQVFVERVIPDDELTAARALPEEEGGLPVDVVVIPRMARRGAEVPGVPVIRSGLFLSPHTADDQRYGTLGMVVTRNNAKFLLTCAHLAEAGTPVFVTDREEGEGANRGPVNPGPEAGVSLGTVQGNLWRLDALVDFMLLAPPAGLRVADGVFGVPAVSRLGRVRRNDTVFRVDQRTALPVFGLVEEVHGEDVPLPGNSILTDAMRVSSQSATPFHGLTHSGSVVLRTEADGSVTAVGLLCAEQGGFGFACHMMDMRNTLNFDV